jgi:hypothetical protein
MNPESGLKDLLVNKNNCENSSVGRARPCQGRGRGFESRFSLSTLPGWWNGRHEGLKILWLHGCVGSSPTSGTIGEENPL